MVKTFYSQSKIENSDSKHVLTAYGDEGKCCNGFISTVNDKSMYYWTAVSSDI